MKSDIKVINYSGSEGMSLVVVMIGIALSGILAMSVSTYATNAFTSAKYISITNQREDLRNFLKVRTNCSKTKAQVTSGNIILYDRKNNPIAEVNAENVLVIKKWLVKVSSYDATTGIFVVEAMHPKEQDPKYRDLFKVDPFKCL